MRQLHDLQIKILEKLLFSQDLNYSVLKPYSDVENNKFNFHLKQLIDMGYVKKDDGIYSLTEVGKEYANRIDTNRVLKLQAKIAVIIVCLKNNDSEALIYTRLKHPFYGCQGYMSGKVLFGESIYTTVSRELKEETNLTGQGKLFLISHERVFDQNTPAVLLEDKFLYYVVVRDPVGNLDHNDEGKFQWVALKDMKNVITKPFVSIETHMEITHCAQDFKEGPVAFIEKDIFSKVF